MNLRTLTDVELVERVMDALRDAQPSSRCGGLDERPRVVHEDHCEFSDRDNQCCAFTIEHSDHCESCVDGDGDLPPDIFELLDELRYRLLAPGAAPSTHPREREQVKTSPRGRLTRRRTRCRPVRAGASCRGTRTTARARSSGRRSTRRTR